MAKFIKSFFNTAERRKASRYEDSLEEDKNIPIPLGRKLSISRSGRMKQANKKRHSLCLDVYNQDVQSTEKLKNTEVQTTQRQSETENNNLNKMENFERRSSLNPEEEIDSAFEIIHKSDL